MPSQCCFWCPAKDFKERATGDCCPACGRPFEAPLSRPPEKIGTYRVQAPLSRGFYGATYRAEQESLKRIVVLKVVPVGIYTFFKKDWAAECEAHAAIAEGTAFIAAITDRFDIDVDFDGAVLPCHVAVLANIPGPTLQQLFEAPDTYDLTPRKAAQVAEDLFEILSVFTESERFHNDLHSGNVIVQSLTAQTMRSGAIEPKIRAVAIDLGSIKDESLSGGSRLGDHAHVARHIVGLANIIHHRSSGSSDVDHRIAGALRGLAEHLAPPAGAQRIMTVADVQRAMRAAIAAAEEPWRQPLSLARFSDAYNAQALESWHVPELWFDPEDKWLGVTRARGPQVITGMRGCGKTMLLRALHFHARAPRTAGKQDSGEPDGSFLGGDEFVGVYSSCQKLLNPQDQSHGASSTVPLPFERLFVAYLRDAVQVLKHLRSLDVRTVASSLDVLLGDALRILDIPEGDLPGEGEQAFEKFLTALQFRLAEDAQGPRLKVSPADAFSHLAMVIRSSSTVLSGKYVLFLLDDVSTRYLSQDMVREVISQLLFQHPHCAFRITTEAQALHRVLLSPGGGTPADPNRDYEEFDLGNEVYRLLQERVTRERMDFVSEILRRRGRQFPDELYRRDPVEVLGDVSLEDIARDIQSSSPTSSERKLAYRGLRAVQAVCVGDLGDVVKLYEKILQRANVRDLPVSAEKQTECFLAHSASLMHSLNRRDQQKKGVALAFAQASGELLHRSNEKRLRQYTKLYVRVDSGAEFSCLAGQLLELLDAGVFVYDGGGPRTKTRDSDPVLQFKLSFRKMLGLASFIGLSDRDRFELSGDALRIFLQGGDHAKRILLDSVAKEAPRDEAGAPEPATPAVAVSGPSPSSSGESERNVKISKKARKVKPKPDPQLGLEIPAISDSVHISPYAPALGVTVTESPLESWADRRFDIAIFALGFEDRASISAERVLAVTKPRRAVLIRYSDDQGADIKKRFVDLGIEHVVVSSIEEMCGEVLRSGPDVLVDSSGMSKSFLFSAVRDAMMKNRGVTVVHTLAAHHFPRNEDLSELGITADAPVSGENLTRLGDVLNGEAGPYRALRVHQAEGSPERWRALIASASPKNDRLLHLLDWRASDATRILVPLPTTPRRRIAWTSAELAASAADANVGLVTVATNDIRGALRVTEELYNDLYYKSGANVELGLTGPKIHAIAFAALAAAARVSAAWYVVPQSFDRQRFTTGAAETQSFELRF